MTDETQADVELMANDEFRLKFDNGMVCNVRQVSCYDVMRGDSIVRHGFVIRHDNFEWMAITLGATSELLDIQFAPTANQAIALLLKAESPELVNTEDAL